MTPRPRWWRRPLTLSTIIAVVLHVPFTPAFPILRATQRLSIMREQPREEEPPDPLSLPVELIDPPSPSPPPPPPTTPSPLPPPPRPGADPEGPRGQGGLLSGQRGRRPAQGRRGIKAAEEANKAEGSPRRHEVWAEKAADEKKAEARKKSDRKDKSKDKDRADGDEPEDGDKGKFAQGGDEPDEDKDSKDVASPGLQARCAPSGRSLMGL